ncbi:hypothetical protein [Nocardiopsis aegyptia]|uniref:Uncharacterized protein n=1 Tax=Nocardiopsis aegyptia TaxID=220378 RepID=A0A7Z0ENW1_9ACTN|nr:hypothetical protein [Nocardiopsis aegyptia]NYJ35504.1 hypothetical protein [Nocardiopsis aegyptia]
MGQGRRTLWGCGAVLPILALVCALGIVGSGEFSADGEAFGMLVVLLVAALGLSALLLRHMPRVLAEQGVSVDATGVGLVQRPKWWFRGRSLTLPWHEIVSVTARAVGDRSESGPSPTSVSFHLRHAPPKDMTPTWAVHVDAATQHVHATVASPHPQITVIPDASRREGLVGAVGGHRPDLLSGQVQVAPVGAPVRGRGAGGPYGPAGAAGPSRVGAEGTVSMRGWRIFQWILYLIVVGSGLLPFTVVAYQVLRPEVLRGELSAAGLLPLAPALVPILIGAVALPVLIVYLPQYWAKQGVTIDRFGISVVTEPLWWSGGHRAHVPWADVHHIAVGSRGSGRSHRVMAEVHLHHVDRELRLPMWAALAMGGESTWGVTATRPVLLIDPRSQGPAADLLSMLRAARGDLFEDARPERNRPQGAAPGTPPARYAGQAYRVPLTPYWRSLRARRGWIWALGFGACAYMLSAIAFMGAMEVERNLERQEYGAFFPPCSGSSWSASSWSGRSARHRAASPTRVWPWTRPASR